MVGRILGDIAKPKNIVLEELKDAKKDIMGAKMLINAFR
jgi:hypothetical protein